MSTCAKLTALGKFPLLQLATCRRPPRIYCAVLLQKRDFSQPISVRVFKRAGTYQQTSRGADHTHSSQRCSRFPATVGGWDPPCFAQRHVQRDDFTLKMKNTHAELDALMSQTAFFHYNKCLPLSNISVQLTRDAGIPPSWKPKIV